MLGGGAGIAWLVTLLLGRCCTGQMIYRTKDIWQQTVYFNCAMADSAFYNVTMSTSRCECRMMCNVDSTCMSVSAVPLDQVSAVPLDQREGFECRTSTEPRILTTDLTQGWDAVTFYKSEAQYSFSPSVGGLFYWAEVKKEKRSDAKQTCLGKGGRLAILPSEVEFQAAVDATQHFGDTGDRFMVDLERENSDSTFVWGDGVANPQQEASDTFDYQTNLGMSIMIETSLLPVASSTRKYKEVHLNSLYPFVCQYNPCGVPW